MDSVDKITAKRYELQAKLEDILGSDEVHFQPPASKEIHYPAIVYSLDKIENVHANNAVYHQFPSYEIIVIHKEPDCDIVYEVSRLPMCRHINHYVADNLYHDVFKLYN